MAKGAKWIRINVDWDGSEWVSVLSEGSQLAWVKFLCYVKMAGTAGTVSRRSPLTLSRLWGMGEESVRKMLIAAEQDGAIESQDDCWVVANWQKYQDESTTRVRAWRERNQPISTKVEPKETLRNVAKRDVTDVTADNDIDNDIDITPPTPSRGKSVGFSIPSIEEVKSYGREIGLAFGECEAFWDYFTSNGWKVGNKAPMKDWKASLRNWKRSPYRNQQSRSLPRASEVTLPT